jgi:hypothetical protein
LFAETSLIQSKQCARVCSTKRLVEFRNFSQFPVVVRASVFVLLL